MRIIGLCSTITKIFSLFFWEYDEVTKEEAIEDTNLLSQIFGIDVYLMESSKGHYHAISFDVLYSKTVQRLQNYSLYQGDYFSIEDVSMWDNPFEPRYCVLRIGAKGTKPKPKLVKFFQRGNRPKALKHFRFYQAFTGIPNPTYDRMKLYVPIGDVTVTVYNSGIGAKPKPFDLQDSLLSEKFL